MHFVLLTAVQVMKPPLLPIGRERGAIVCFMVGSGPFVPCHEGP